MRISHRPTCIFVVASCTGIAATLVHSAVAADTYEQILERCRSSVSSQVQSCMQFRKGTGDRESNLEACRAPVKPIVQACVQRESQRAAAGKAAPSAPKADTAAPKDAVAIRAVFVAPPRTITDITDILDKERRTTPSSPS
jgi:hypothetical protein